MAKVIIFYQIQKNSVAKTLTFAIIFIKLKNTVNKLKKKWGIRRTVDIVLILIVFPLAGMSIVYVRVPVFEVLGIEDTHIVIKTMVYLLIVFPTYQFFLLFFGLLFGQFQFFWDKEKKMARWISNKFQKSNSK